MIYALFRGQREQVVDEIGVWIRYSFTALVCLSFVSQMFVPAYGLIMPLMGDGVCMIVLLVVYISLWQYSPDRTWKGNRNPRSADGTREH